MDQQNRIGARVRGCLLGGAVGNALGAPLRGLSLADIRRRFGPRGLTDYVETDGRLGTITADTQTALFTSEGLVRAYVRARLKGICHPPSVIHHALLRFAHAQGVKLKAHVAHGDGWPDGWLVGEPRLWARRGPGKTSVGALRDADDLGERAANESKGCGAVVRVAPVGLVASAHRDAGPPPAFQQGVEVAALTHGHPAATFSAGAFALLIGLLMDGLEMKCAVDAMYAVLAPVPGSGFVTRSLDRALAVAREGGEVTAEKIEQLGGGWVAEEALSIAVYAALVAKDFEHGVCLAVNHSGDSDSTGALVGQLLGAAFGADAIPARRLVDLELRDVIERIADDLVAVRTERLDPESAWKDYPGW